MMPDVIFCLDADNRIIRTNAAWDAFALENGAAELLGKNIRGKSLFGFIVDDATRMYVRVLLDSARTLQRPVSRAYRCDSEDLKRYMEMLIEPSENGQLVLKHKILRTEAITSPLRYHYQPDRAMIFRCSSCNRLQLPDSGWQEAELIDLQRQQDGATRVSYTICTDCQQQLPAAPATPTPMKRGTDAEKY
jgi:hypothetical protein